MKELSVEEKAKRFDEALAIAKECITYISDDAVNKYMLNIFPELIESEDDKIRKAIIEFFKLQDDNTTYSFVPKKDILVWLEKQGESDETKAKIFLINRGYPIDTNGTFPTYEEMYNIIRDGVEKQGEKPQYKESEDIQIMKEIAEFIYNSAFKPKDIKKKEKWLTWLEKQSAQKGE